MPRAFVSVLMPVYNCSEFARGNGKILITQALDSLLAQTYSDFEILLLDNQSNDRTPEICAEYAAKDSRIRYLPDTCKRTIDEAFAYLPTLMRGKYCFCANDDDMYHPEYIEALAGYLDGHADVDLVYPNCDYIDIAGKTIQHSVVSEPIAYYAAYPPIANFSKYVKVRNPIPLVFGMYRAEAYKAVQPTVAFDKLGANVDNLQVLKFFLQQQRVHFLEKTYFYYRTKSRPLRGPDTPLSRFPKDFPPFDEPLLIWAYYVRHQFYFKRTIEQLIETSHFGAAQKLFLKILTAEAFVMHSLNLLTWIRDDETRPDDHVNRTRIDLLLQQIQKNFDSVWLTHEAISPIEYPYLESNRMFIRIRREAAREGIARLMVLVRTSGDLVGSKSPLVDEVISLLQDEISSNEYSNIISAACKT